MSNRLLPGKLLIFLLTANPFAPDLRAQTREPTHRILNAPAPSASGGFGDHAIGIGDMDGDGFADYAVAAPHFNVAGPNTQYGRVYVYSGRTSALQRTFDGDQTSADFGLAMADVGDVNSDGIGDLAIGARSHDGGAVNGGRVAVFSGATGGVIWSLLATQSGSLGESLGAIADITGDGVRDLAAGQPGFTGLLTGSGRVVFINGATGVVIGTATGTSSFESLGKTIATRPTSGLVYSGAANGKTYLVPTPSAGIAVPVLYLAADPTAAGPPQLALVAGPGSSGLRLLVGRPSADSGGLLSNGSVELYPPGSTTPLFSLAGVATSESVGYSIVAVPDFDGDGAEDIGFASAGGVLDPGRVRIVSQTGAQLDDVSRQGGIQNVLAAITDVTGDGRGEWINAIASGLSLIFESTLFSSGLTLTSSAGTGGGFSATFSVYAGLLNASRPYVHLYGFSGAAPGTQGPPPWPLVPLNIDAMTSVILGLAGSPMFPDAIGTLNGAGTATTTMALPAGIPPLLSGLTVTTAVVVLDPPGTAVVHASDPVLIPFP